MVARQIVMTDEEIAKTTIKEFKIDWKAVKRRSQDNNPANWHTIQELRDRLRAG